MGNGVAILTHSTLEKGAFPAPQREVRTAAGIAAVVAAEDQHGVVPHGIPFERSDDLRGHVVGDGCHCCDRPLLGAPPGLRSGVQLDQLDGRLDRLMHHMQRRVEEERAGVGRLPIHNLNHVGGMPPRVIASAVPCVGSVVLPAVDRTACGLGQVIAGALEVPGVVLKATVGGEVFGTGKPVMPLRGRERARGLIKCAAELPRGRGGGGGGGGPHLNRWRAYFATHRGTVAGCLELGREQGHRQVGTKGRLPSGVGLVVMVGQPPREERALDGKVSVQEREAS